MGTRALIIPKDSDGKEICVIYTQYDGYPDGIMLEVARFLSTREVVNGFGLNDFYVFNGMDDLAGQLITFLKLMVYKLRRNWIEKFSKKAMEEKNAKLGFMSDFGKLITCGNIYVMPAGTRDVMEEFIYYIKPDGKGGVIIEAYDVHGDSDKPIFVGTPKEYIEKFAPK